MAKKEEFSIETKLKIAGVEATGNLDGGTLKFNVDTSAFKKLVTDATKTAAQVKKKLDSIRLNKIKIELNQNSLRAVESQIRKAITNAVKKVSVDVGANVTGGKGKAGAKTGKAEKHLDAFANYIKEANKSARSFARTMQRLVDVAKSMPKGAIAGGTATAKAGDGGSVPMPGGGGLPAPGGAGSVPMPAGAQKFDPNDPKQLKAAIEQAKKELERFQSEVPKNVLDRALNIPQLTRDIRAFAKNFDATVTTALQGTMPQAMAAQQSIRQAVKAFNELREAQGKSPMEAGQAFEQLRKMSGQQAKQEAAQQTKIANELERGAKAAFKEQQARRQSIQAAQKELDTLMKRRSAMGGGGGGGGIRGSQPGFGSFGMPNFGQSAKGANNTRDAVQGLEGDIKKTIDQLIRYRAVGFVWNEVSALVRESTKFVIEFNDALIELNKIAKLSAIDLQSVGTRLLDISRATGVSADQVATLAQEFARAGVTTKGYGTVVDLTNTAVLGLQGTTLSAEQASQVLIQTIGQLEAGQKGLQKELITGARLFDVLGKAEDITASKASDVATALKRSAASLFATGADIEEVTSIISVLQQTTQRGGEVIGTALKTVASRVSNSSSDAAKALKSIGVETTTSSGELKNIIDILRETKSAFEGMSDAEQANILVSVAGVRQVEILRSALNGLNDVETVLAKTRAASGDAERKAIAERSKTSNQLQRIRTEFDKLALTASEGLLGEGFKSLLSSVDGLLKGLNSLNTSMGGVVSKAVVFTAMVAAFQFLRKAIPAVGKSMAQLVGALTDSNNKTKMLSQNVSETGNKVTSQLNTSFEGTSTVLSRMNAQMKQFTMQTEQATIKAEMLAVARRQAMAEMGPGASAGQVSFRSQEILRQQQQASAQQSLAQRAAQSRAFDRASDRRSFQTGGSSIALREAQKKGVIGINKLGQSATTANSALATLANTVAGPLLTALGMAMVESQQGKEGGTAAGLSTIGSAAAGAGIGLMFGGPMGAAIGGAAGSVYGLIKSFNQLEKTIDLSKASTEDLAKFYEVGIDRTTEYGKQLASQLEMETKNIAILNESSKAKAKDQLVADELSEAQKKSAENLKNAQDAISRTVGSSIKSLAGFDFSNEKLADIGSATASQISAGQLFNIIEALENAIPEAASDEEAREANEKILNMFSRVLKGPAAGQDPALFRGQILNLISQDFAKLIATINENIKDRTADQREANAREAQADAIRNMSYMFVDALGDASTVYSQQTSAFEAGLLGFANKISRSINSLNKSLLEASTPQRELAAAMGQMAQQDLMNAQTQADQDQKQFVQEFRNSLAELTAGGEFSLGGSTASINEVAASLSDALLTATRDIRDQRITDTKAQRKTIQQAAGGALPVGAKLTSEQLEKLFDITSDLAEKTLKADSDVAKKRIAANRAAVASLQALLTEQERELSISKARRDIAKINAEAQIQSLTGSRQLIAQRKLEVAFTAQSIQASQDLISSLDERIAKEQAVLDQDSKNVAARDKLFILQEKRTDAAINLESQLANARLQSAKATISLSKAALEQTQQFASFQKTFVAGVNGIVDVLAVGRTPIEEFNAKLSANSQQFRMSQAELAAEAEVVNSTISDQAERTAALTDIQRRSAQVTLEAAKAEADIIAERRESVKQITGQLLQNQDAQIQAQGQIIEATKGVSAAFQAYRDAANGSILATTRYNINLKLTETANQKLLGSLNGTKQEIDAVSSIFRQAESTARQMGSSERTLLEIRRDSINQQLQLFNNLLSEQSSLARQFFQGSAQGQADLFLGLQEAGGVAELLGGSFDSFKKMGESAINDLGSQLLALPQESRQRIIQSLETLKTVGGSVGGFGAQELLTAIETASLGVSGEGLNVDPLFEVQQRIADLSEQQARLATDDLINAQEGVRVAKEALDQAKAQKDLAEIQLERIREEGTQLRSKLGNLQGELKSSILRGTEVQKNGFNNVAGAINRMSNQVLTRLPEAFSMAVAQEFRNNMSAVGLDSTMPTQMSPGAQQAQALRQAGNNVAQNIQGQRAAASQLSTISSTADSAQRNQNNLPGGTGSEQTNKILETIKQEIQDLLTQTNTALTSIDANTSTGGTGSTAAATQLTPLPDINVNIAGQQQIQVTGFEAGVQQIVAGLVETFGGFVTDTEATNIANQVVESIRLQLERLGILNRNQL